jgi:hypothetical protein
MRTATKLCLFFLAHVSLISIHPPSHRTFQPSVVRLSDLLFIIFLSRFASTHLPRRNMDGSREHEAGRQRMRELFQQREAERGSLKHKQPIFKTAEQEAQQQRRKQQQQQQQQQGGVVWTPNAVARQKRLPTASRGQRPVFDENIWDEDRRPQRVNQDRSVSPKTRIAKDDNHMTGSSRTGNCNGNSNGHGNGNVKTTSGNRPPQASWKRGSDGDKPRNTVASNRKKPS